MGKSIVRSFWKGVFVAKGTSQNIVDDLRNRTETIKRDPEFIEALNKIGIAPAPELTASEIVTFIEKENAIFSSLMTTYDMKKQ